MGVIELPSQPEEVASLIDHTNVEPDATEGDIRKLCDEVLEYGFCSAVVVPYHAPLTAELLGETANVVVVVGFPYGVQHPQAKAAEAAAVLDFADELDMVMNRTAFANEDYEYVTRDIKAVKEAVGEKPVKCIIESPSLSRDGIRTAARLVAEGGADFVKTAVGYEGNCDSDDVRVIREAVGPDMGVKASGGIRSFAEMASMIEAGATRIGASSSVEIIDSMTG